MESKTIKRFVRDFNLPIQIPNEEYIEYFINLYDNILDTKEKFNMFDDLVKRLDGEEGFFVQSANIQNSIINSIKELDSYKQFISNSMDNFEVKKDNIQKGQVYKTFNHNNWFLSIDLVKANYNALKYYSNDLVLNSNNYKSFVELFTNEQYYLESKKFRQVVFGNINPKRQQRIQRFLIDQLLSVIMEYISVDNIKDITSDEVVLLMNNSKINFFGTNLYRDLLIKINQLHIDVRFDLYQLKQLKPYDYYVREFVDGRIDFRCVPLNHYAQVYKHYFKQPLNEIDLMFYTSDYELVKFMYPLKFERK